MQMFDSTTPSDIPRDAPAVMGYVDGAFKWTATDWLLFPAAVHVTLGAVDPATDADGYDCETGDYRPDQIPDILNRRRAMNTDPFVYCSLSTQQDVIRECIRRQVRLPLWGIADPTGSPHVVPGSVFTQWAWPGRGSPAHYDISETVAGWPRKETETPVNMSERFKRIANPDGPGGWELQRDGGIFAYGGAPGFPTQHTVMGMDGDLYTFPFRNPDGSTAEAYPALNVAEKNATPNYYITDGWIGGP